jgi:hypothetical protein
MRLSGDLHTFAGVPYPLYREVRKKRKKKKKKKKVFLFSYIKGRQRVTGVYRAKTAASRAGFSCFKIPDLAHLAYERLEPTKTKIPIKKFTP